MDYQPMNCLTEFDVESAIKTWREDGFEDGYTEGRTDGIAEGITQGRTDGKLEDARKLLELNTMSVEQIAYVTELPIEQIHELQQQIANNAEQR